jgi:hypothetical protein
VLGLKRAFDGDADIVSLILLQLRQFDADPGQMQAGDFFVQQLGQDVHAGLVFVALGPQFDLRQHLIGKGC